MISHYFKCCNYKYRNDWPQYFKFFELPNNKLNVYLNMSNSVAVNFFFLVWKLWFVKLLHGLLALCQCNHHVKPFLKYMYTVTHDHLVWSTPTPPIRKKANCTSWCYPNQIFDCIMTLIIWLHSCVRANWFVQQISLCSQLYMHKFWNY